MRQIEFIIEQSNRGSYFAKSACREIYAQGTDLCQVINNIYEIMAQKYSGNFKDYIIHMRFDKKDLLS